MAADKFIEEYFLFTVLGVLLLPSYTYVFSIGDGAYAINGRLRQIGPYADDDPPYPAYQLLTKRQIKLRLRRAASRLVICAKKPTHSIESVLIATDGFVPIMRSGNDGAENRLPITAHELRKRFVRYREKLQHSVSYVDDATAILIRRRA